ncbi:WxL domain-containing protein [Enterococcus sp. S22(2020)]|uniref:WxL domain-containing protein n=2 Tax=unclassified Enterococcus TaxID=2608891 RepID=UPI001CE10501|nr:WxL domain-containing protein [Enterococcus sp. S22(2020)]
MPKGEGTSMKKAGLLLALSIVSLLLKPLDTAATATSYSGDATVQFTGKHPKQVMDPENPGNPADPGDSPSTDRQLRFDFVPQINFGEAEISDTDQTYYGHAQLFKDDTGARGNFIQVSDFRDKSTGWALQIKQETQFQNRSAKNQKLKGAVLSFDQSWSNSLNDPATAPTVSKEVIRLLNIGETYNLAEAKPQKGEGTWSIIFGASVSNDKNRADTLRPKLDEKNNPILDPAFNNQPIYENQAVSLFIPAKGAKEPGNYQTVLTWILSELP